MLEVDTVILDKCISDFTECVSTYNDEIDSFFSEINNFNGWSGKAAITYKEMAAVEKEKYVKFGEDLYKFSDTLSSILMQITSTSVSSAKD